MIVTQYKDIVIRRGKVAGEECYYYSKESINKDTVVFHIFNELDDLEKDLSIRYNTKVFLNIHRTDKEIIS
jgi:hypothetical protein